MVVTMVKRVRKSLSARVAPVVQVDPRQLALEIVAQIRGETGVTFKALADAWLAANSARLVSPANEWRHVRHLKALWDARETELTPTAITGVLSSLPLSGHTRNKIRSTGKRIINAAIGDRRWGGPNPFAHVARFTQTKPVFRVLSVEEIGRILPHLREDRRRLVKVMLLLGMRPGELLGMRKADVDLTKRVVLVRRSHHRATTKTGAWREVPIPDTALPDITAAMVESPSEFVFPRKDGRRQRRDTKLARTLRTAMGRAGLVSRYDYSCRRKGCGYRESRQTQEEARCPKCRFKLWIQPVPQRARFYDLRHSAATLHRQAGADPLAIKLTLGHALRDQTDGTYTHLTSEDVRRELEKLKLETGENGMLSTEPMGKSLGSSCSTPELPPHSYWPRVEPQPLLTVKDVAARLNVKRAAVYRLVEAGRLPVLRIGSLLRFRPQDVAAFVGGAQ